MGNYDEMLKEHQKKFGNNFVLFCKCSGESRGMYEVFSIINDGIEFKKMCNDLKLKFLKSPEPYNCFDCGVIVFDDFDNYIKKTDYPVFVYNYNKNHCYELVKEYNTCE
jgi:hypothetical protein